MTAISPPIDLGGSKQRQRRERAVRIFFLGAACSSIAISIAIVLSLVTEAFNFITEVELGALWTDGWFPRRALFDLRTLFVGSLIVTGVAMIVATPLGLGAAIYLSEYANAKVRKVLKPILEILAGIPSIVIAFFAISWISPEVVQGVLKEGATRSNLMAAGLGVGILVTPLVASVSEDALRAVPRSLREAAYGLGAKRVTVSLRVVFPAAISGIVASLMLAASRAIGETMVVALAAGGSGGTQFTTDVYGPGQTMTAAMMNLVAGSDQVATDAGGANLAYGSLFFLGLLLFLVTMGLNVIGDRFVRRVREKY